MTSKQHNQLIEKQLDQLKDDYADRQGKRPMPHSISVAYKQLIAAREQHGKKPPQTS